MTRRDVTDWLLGGEPWQQRPVFGMVRFMNESGLRRKFDIEGLGKERL